MQDIWRCPWFCKILEDVLDFARWTGRCPRWTGRCPWFARYWKMSLICKILEDVLDLQDTGRCPWFARYWKMSLICKILEDVLDLQDTRRCPWFCKMNWKMSLICKMNWKMSLICKILEDVLDWKMSLIMQGSICHLEQHVIETCPDSGRWPNICWVNFFLACPSHLVEWNKFLPIKVSQDKPEV